jgi:methylase of polypeptide subunit release factors
VGEPGTPAGRAAALRDDVGPVSVYSLSLAENIPDLTGQTVVDVGSGSGFLSIVARLQGAARVYLLDTYESTIALALENAERNRVREGLIHLPIGSSMIPLPEGERVNVIISNPAQLPLPQMERENSPFYAGPEGRSMIEAIIKEAPNKLAPSGRVLITHNSMANLSKSLHLFESMGIVLLPNVLSRFGNLLIESGLIHSAETLRVFIPLKTASPTRPSMFLGRNCGSEGKLWQSRCFE